MSAKNGREALQTLETRIPDLVLLDLKLPDINGEGVCLEIRKDHPFLPIIMLTAKDSATDTRIGFQAGADDYVSKPFAPGELLARIHARLRQIKAETSSTLQIANLELDPQKLIVTRAGKQLQLTPQEFKLLHYLMMNVGIVLTREMILNRIWSASPDIESRVVDVYIGYLRKKIDKDNAPKLIHSIRGFGYTLKQ